MNAVDYELQRAHERTRNRRRATVRAAIKHAQPVRVRWARRAGRRADEKFPAIAGLLRHSENYPHEGHVGTVNGFLMNRDQLIALLGECTPALSSIAVIPHHIGDGDMTAFEINVHVSFARSEVGMTVATNQANRGSEES